MIVCARAVGVVLGALLVAGCGAGAGDSSGTASSASPVPSTSSVPSPSASASMSDTPTETPSASAEPVPPPATAADGTRYSACADGTCEVAVSRPVRIKIKGGRLSVTKVRAGDVVTYDLTLTGGGGGSGTLGGTCGEIFRIYRGGGVQVITCHASGVPARPKAERGSVALQFLGWTSGGAGVVRVVSG